MKFLFLYKVNPEYSNKYGTLTSGISSFYKDHLIKHGIKVKTYYSRESKSNKF